MTAIAFHPLQIAGAAALAARLEHHDALVTAAEVYALDHDCDVSSPIYAGAGDLEKLAKDLGAVLFKDGGHDLMVGFSRLVAEQTDAHHWLNLWWSGIGSWRY